VIVGVYTLVLTWVLAKVAAMIVPMRADAESEFNGLDLSSHGERAYDITS
jgi:ammonium transporter, Amt family